MDLIMDYNQTKMLVDEIGWDGFLSYYSDMYSRYNFYKCSTSWYDDEKYICKFKGSNGDLIIGWSGVHD